MGTAKIIGLTGFAGAGKSEVAKILVASHGFRLMKFAEGLKDMLRAISLSERQIEGDAKETPSRLLCGKTPRHAMVTLGTEWGRNLIGEDLWVHVLQKKIESLRRLYGPDQLKIVIDDCRFMNEATMIRSLGGVIWNVQRPGVDAKTDHKSEIEHLMIPDQWALRNNGSVDWLKSVVAVTLEAVNEN